MEALIRAFEAVGSQAALARKLGIKPQVINNWTRRGVPIERCASIERATDGKVKRSDLRPDIFGSSKSKRPRRTGARAVAA